MHVPRPRSLAGQLFAMQAVLIAAVVAGCAVFTYLEDRSQAEESARKRATAVAHSIADSPSVHEAIRRPRPTVRLQPYAERVRRDTGVTFITIMDPEGVRWTHPNPRRIGGTFVGHTAPALRGRTFSEIYTGTLGPSVRVVTPIRDDGRIVGLVSSGIAVEEISEQVQQQVTGLLGVAGIALALGGAGTYIISTRLRRHTHGMNAAELSRVHDYHQAALHAVREGLLMLDGQRRIALINDGARELLGVTGERVIGRNVAELGLPRQLTGALLASESRVDEVHLTAERVVLVNTSPVSGGERRGSVVTLRDHTELQSLAGELDSVRGFAEALRSQAHESANRLHTVVSLIELGRAQEAADFATEELELAQALTDQVVAAVGEPVLAALLLGKAAQAHERGVELVLAEESSIDDGIVPPRLPPRDLVTLLGNLIDNAVDATAQESSGPRAGRSPSGGRAEGGPAASAYRAPRVTVTVRTDRRDGANPAGQADGAGAAGQADGANGATGADGANPAGPAVLPDPAGRADGADHAAPAGAANPVAPVAPADGGTELLIRVADTGPGVSAAASEDVFRRGWSTKAGTHPGTADGHGSGLGLALVRQTARRHGGTVELGEAAGGGAEFTVRLPLTDGPGSGPDGAVAGPRTAPERTGPERTGPERTGPPRTEASV